MNLIKEFFAPRIEKLLNLSSAVLDTTFWIVLDILFCNHFLSFIFSMIIHTFWDYT